MVAPKGIAGAVRTDELAQRHTCQFLDLAGQVRLIGIASMDRDVGERNASTSEGHGPAEAQDPLQGLGPITEGGKAAPP